MADFMSVPSPCDQLEQSRKKRFVITHSGQRGEWATVHIRRYGDAQKHNRSIDTVLCSLVEFN
jgi:hypothetical protein